MYFARNILAVRFCDYGIFLKDIMHQLRSDNHFDLAIDSLRARIHQLTRLAFFLALCSSLCKKEVLRRGMAR